MKTITLFLTFGYFKGSEEIKLQNILKTADYVISFGSSGEGMEMLLIIYGLALLLCVVLLSGVMILNATTSEVIEKMKKDIAARQKRFKQKNNDGIIPDVRYATIEKESSLAYSLNITNLHNRANILLLVYDIMDPLGLTLNHIFPSKVGTRVTLVIDGVTTHCRLLNSITTGTQPGTVCVPVNRGIPARYGGIIGGLNSPCRHPLLTVGHPMHIYASSLIGPLKADIRSSSPVLSSLPTTAFTQGSGPSSNSGPSSSSGPSSAIN